MSETDDVWRRLMLDDSDELRRESEEVLRDLGRKHAAKIEKRIIDAITGGHNQIHDLPIVAPRANFMMRKSDG